MSSDFREYCNLVNERGVWINSETLICVDIIYTKKLTTLFVLIKPVFYFYMHVAY